MAHALRLQDDPRFFTPLAEATTAGRKGDWLCPHCSTYRDNQKANSITCIGCSRHYHLHCVTIPAGIDPKHCKDRHSCLAFICQSCKAHKRTMSTIVTHENLRDIVAEQLQLKLAEANENLVQEHNKLKQDFSAVVHREAQNSRQIAAFANEREQFFRMNEEFEKVKADFVALQAQHELLNQQRLLTNRNDVEMEQEFLGFGGNANIEALINDRFRRFETAIIERVENIVMRIGGNQNEGRPAPMMQAARGRSASRNGRATSRKGTQAVVVSENIRKMSYAQALNNAKIKPSNVLNVEILRDAQAISEDIIQTRQVDAVIFSSKQKSENFTTIKCTNEEDTDRVQTQLQTKYGNKIRITKVQPRKPSIRITNVPLLSTNEQLIIDMREQNAWIGEQPLIITDSYEITTTKRKYRNITVQCELPLHQKFLEKGIVIIGFVERKVYENIDLLQCKNCHRFGHTKNHCEYATRCYKCSENHEVDTCEMGERAAKCFNCISNNKNGADFNTNHKFNNHRCPSRLERIDALKAYLQKN